MRAIFAVSLIFTVFFSGTYWYYSNASLCRYPIAYSIGEFDERFSITEAEARVAIHDAETLWEEAVGENLFNYKKGASFKVNFIFDDRQEMSDEERIAREELEAIEAENVLIGEQYATLIEQYSELRYAHRVEVEAYERRLSRYNAAVEEANAAGGATPDVYEELATEQAELAEIAADLDERVAALNQLTNQINELGEEGNRVVERYNHRVAAYNEQYGTGREFTQGDYNGGEINIYTFSDDLELRQVLAHELGHALALEHVDDPRAIMYYLMGTQHDTLQLTSADRAEFDRVCGDGPSMRGLIYQFVRSFGQ